MEILKLADKWERLARNKFITADDCSDPAGRTMLQHGAFCHMNAATELRDALANRRPVAFRIGKLEVEMTWGVAMILVGGIGMLAVEIWKY